jgi:hypothetical protein
MYTGEHMYIMRRPELYITKHMIGPSFEHSASADSGVSLPLVSPSPTVSRFLDYQALLSQLDVGHQVRLRTT